MTHALPVRPKLVTGGPHDAARRGLADLRGAAGRAARHRRIRRPVTRAARREGRVRRLLGQLEGRTEATVAIHIELDDARRSARGHPPLPFRPRTINGLYLLMAVCDTLLVASALQDAKATLSPLGALVLAAGISVALVVLGRRLGHELTEFDRLGDQSARWGVIATLLLAVVAIASVGLTLLRTVPTWSWPLLALAVPFGSAALTWLTDDPAQLRVARLEGRLQRSRRAGARLDRRLLRNLGHAARLRTTAEYRLRARLAAAVRRAILDGAVAGDDLGTQSEVVDQLVRDHLPASHADELTLGRDRCVRRLSRLTDATPSAPLFDEAA